MEREFFCSARSGYYRVRVAGAMDDYVMAHRLETSSEWQAGLPVGMESENIIGWAEYLERTQREERR